MPQVSPGVGMPGGGYAQGLGMSRGWVSPRGGGRYALEFVGMSRGWLATPPRHTGYDRQAGLTHPTGMLSNTVHLEGYFHLQ